MVGPKRFGPKVPTWNFQVQWFLLKSNEKFFGIQKIAENIAEKISQKGLFVPFGPKCMYPFSKPMTIFCRQNRIESQCHLH